MRKLDSAALDRYITGNYGEDRFRACCKNCGRLYYEYDDGTLCGDCKKVVKNDDNQH